MLLGGTACGSQAEEQLAQAQAHVPRHGLRNALLAAAGSPQVFLANRAHYAR